MIFSLFQIQAGNRFVVSHQVCTAKFIGHLCTWAMISYLKHKYETLLGADRLTFDGGGGWVTTSGFLHM